MIKSFEDIDFILEILVVLYLSFLNSFNSYVFSCALFTGLVHSSISATTKLFLEIEFFFDIAFLWVDKPMFF